MQTSQHRPRVLRERQKPWDSMRQPEVRSWSHSLVLLQAKALWQVFVVNQGEAQEAFPNQGEEMHSRQLYQLG